MDMSMATCRLSKSRHCTPSPTTDGTQSQHATLPSSLGQNTARKKIQTLLQCNREDTLTGLTRVGWDSATTTTAAAVSR